MVKVNIVFTHKNQYGLETRESIIGNVETNSNGDIELETIMKKIKSYGYAKTRVSDLKVTHYGQLIDTGLIELV